MRLIQDKQADTLIQFIGANPLETAMDFEETLKFIASLPFDSHYLTSTTIICYYLQYLTGSPLLREHPELPSMPRSKNAWFRNALLMDIRFVSDDAVFAPIYAEYGKAGDHAAVMKLRALRNCLYDTRFKDFFMPKIAELAGGEVYYWGCGDIYHKNKKYLGGLKAKAILLDLPYSGPPHIDGIPVLHPDEVADRPLPLIIFSGRPSYIYRKIRRNWPQFTQIIPCARSLAE